MNASSSKVLSIDRAAIAATFVATLLTVAIATSAMQPAPLLATAELATLAGVTPCDHETAAAAERS